MATTGYYARLNGGGGRPILPVMYITSDVEWSDDLEPYCSVRYYDGNDIGDGDVSFDYLYKRCAPISRDTAYRLASELVDDVEKGQH